MGSARKLAAASVVALGVQPGHANDNAGTHMTAGVILERMSASDRFTYVAGMIEGFAFHRYHNDTRDAGKPDSTGLSMRRSAQTGTESGPRASRYRCAGAVQWRGAGSAESGIGPWRAAYTHAYARINK